MAKKQWISVKCGLSRDPKHRQAMGESVWLFLHILDRADWESGKVMEWKDEGEADEMGMPVRTLREHRRKLEELDYISCAQKQYGQEITIHNWTNPREYSGAVANKKQGYMEASPQKEEQGYTQGYTQGNREDVTPTSNSKNQRSKKEAATPKPPQPPEILLFKEVVNHYPKQNQRTSIIEAVLKINARLLRPATASDLLPFWEKWGTVSGNEWSLVWLVDWAVAGTTQPAKKQTNFDRTLTGLQKFMANHPDEVYSSHPKEAYSGNS